MSNRYYGESPISLGIHKICCNEMMFYQDYIIKDKNQHNLLDFDKRIFDNFDNLIYRCETHFKETFGTEEFEKRYMYVCAKSLFQQDNKSYNRLGWHSDGFMSDDINYIWSDKNPTMISEGMFNLTLDDKISIKEMTEQAMTKDKKVYTINESELVMLSQYNIHAVNPIQTEGVRTFLKVTFSKDKFDLVGNALNSWFDYKGWEFKQRGNNRNIPQSCKHETKYTYPQSKL